jgi:hypothetical protein
MNTTRGTRRPRRSVPGQAPSGPAARDRQDDPKAAEARLRAIRLSFLRLKEDRCRAWTPWLFIRYTTFDLGIRPIPNGIPFWESPDIWIESSDPDPSKAVPGEDNFLHVRIFNLGKADAAPTRVDFYWADPSAGLGPGNMNLIGTEWVEIPAHTAVELRCAKPWVPTYLNGGHECLMVNCSNPILDPITSPFQPTLDRHVGQRNIAVLQPQAGHFIEFPFNISNLLPLSARVSVTASLRHLIVDAPVQQLLAYHQAHARRRGVAPHAVIRADTINRALAFGQGEINTPDEIRTRFKPDTAAYAQANCVADYLSNTDRVRAYVPPGVRAAPVFGAGAPSIHAQLTEHRCTIVPADEGAFAGQLLQGGGVLAGGGACRDGGGILLHEIDMEAAEQRRCMIRLGTPPTGRAGEFVVCRLAQRAGGMLLGGYTIIAELPA